ncbi:TrbC/VirB2 family protein [Chromobacterium vaccinii]|uniref:TrbC/VirB2 family protein n=1 Tax=Chromobacterium vaccinii TaxID=1108595 RepID=UPI003C7269FD
MSEIQQMQVGEAMAKPKKDYMDIAAKVQVGAMLMLYAGAALASSGGSDFGDSLCRLVNVFNGKVSFAVLMLGIIAGALTWIFGEEMNGMLKKLVNIVFAGGVIVGGAGLLKTLFPSLNPC